MIFYRYALTALALAACQLVAAQTQSALDEAFTGAPPAGTEPRFIRGNDRVIAPAKPAPQIQGAPLSFNFEEAPVTEVVRTILGDILKVDYVLHPPLSGTVTMATRTPMSPDQAVAEKQKQLLFVYLVYILQLLYTNPLRNLKLHFLCYYQILLQSDFFEIGSSF